MRKLLYCCLVALFFSSCQGVWTQDDKDAFFEACMDDTKAWVDDPQKAKQYCECVTIKVMERYTDVNDALENIETLSRDPDIRNCRMPIMK